MASSGVSTVMVSATTPVLPSVALGCLHIASAIPTKSQHAALNVIVLFIFTSSVNSSANILLFSKNISFARQFYKYQLLSLSNFIKDNAKNLQLSWDRGLVSVLPIFSGYGRDEVFPQD